MSDGRGRAQAYPLDLVRTRLAAQTGARYYHGIAHALHTIVREEGARGLYSGLGATLLQARLGSRVWVSRLEPGPHSACAVRKEGARSFDIGPGDATLQNGFELVL